MLPIIQHFVLFSLSVTSSPWRAPFNFQLIPFMIRPTQTKSALRRGRPKAILTAYFRKEKPSSSASACARVRGARGSRRVVLSASIPCWWAQARA